jgi:dGTPase
MCFERDRDRVIHSRCFRRLEYKAQVFVNGTADHYRTRLTHTTEMAAVSRTVARVLGVQEDLTEAIVLAHDVGHTPFGHCGEFALEDCMREHGGFDHNRQSLRWVDFLEVQYPDFPGLNLSWEVRAGLMKHEAATPGIELDSYPIGPFQFVEAQIADVADDITYYAHDTDDALEAGVLTERELTDQPLWRRAVRRTMEQYASLTEDEHARITVRNLLDIMVADLVDTATAKLNELQPQNYTEVMTAPERVVALSTEMGEIVKQFRDFLYERFYFSPAVKDGTDEGRRMTKMLFDHYVSHPETMGRKARNRIASEGLERTVCDYVSGFTDRYAMEECQRFQLGE